jgi:hypothetical protein
MTVEVLRILAIVGVLIAPFAAVSVLLARAETGAWPLYRAWLPALIVPLAVLYGDWAERHRDTARQLDSGTVFLLLLLLVILLVVRRPHRLAQLSAHAGLAAPGFTAAFALTGIFGEYGETHTDQATVAVLLVAAALLTAALLVDRLAAHLGGADREHSGRDAVRRRGRRAPEDRSPVRPGPCRARCSAVPRAARRRDIHRPLAAGTQRTITVTRGHQFIRRSTSQAGRCATPKPTSPATLPASQTAGWSTAPMAARTTNRRPVDTRAADDGQLCEGVRAVGRGCQRAHSAGSRVARPSRYPCTRAFRGR